ncbi:MAG: hypothetical protein H7Y04_10425 [Verrucomicrobia bacterium]|nr:hypothetical protein [Cytophagales bacterium]
MKDTLKTFIQTHTEAFETEEPSEALWQKIENRLEKPASKPEIKQENLSQNFSKKSVFFQPRFLQVAASVLLLLVAGMGIYIFNQENKSQTAQNQELKTEEVTKFAPELVEAETFYTTQINEKRQQLRKYNNPFGAEADAELQRLDATYKELKKQLFDLKDVNNQQLTDAMLENLRIRTEMLNEQLEIMEEIKKRQQKQTNKNL